MAALKGGSVEFLLRNYRLFVVSSRHIRTSEFSGSSFNTSRPESNNSLTSEDVKTAGGDGDMEFRKLDLYGRKSTVATKQRQYFKHPISPPRYLQMPVDQDWTNVWPTAHSFKPSVVPLPLRQGYNQKGVPPGKFGNAELMKIPNFLHLTPPAIKKHCAAIKKFCTPWPKALKTDEDCELNFPIKVTTSDYCHSGPSLHDVRARIVTLQLRLSHLKLNKHAKDKILRLVGARYHPHTDMLTIITDRCPLKKQNYDYAIYLLTALYHESWKVEPWESDKEEMDMEEYVWEGSKSQLGVIHLLTEMKIASNKSEQTSTSDMVQSLPDNCTKEDIVHLDGVQKYGEAVTTLHNKGEDTYTLNRYKEYVKALLHLPGQQPILGEVA